MFESALDIRLGSTCTSLSGRCYVFGASAQLATVLSTPSSDFLCISTRIATLII